MKYFKLIGDQDQWPSFKVGRVYGGLLKDKQCKSSVQEHAASFPEDWLQVPKPKKSLSEKIERLKKQAEKEGMKCEVVVLTEDPNQNWVEPTFKATNTKDEWEGVEFAECINPNLYGFKKGMIYKFIEGKSIDEHSCFINDLGIEGSAKGNPSGPRNCFKPSTESAYVEQLKAKAKELYGEIKDGDRFDRSDLGRADRSGIGVISGWFSTKGFQYYKDEDYLSFNGTLIYRKGKWAKRVKERVIIDPKDILTQSSPMEYGTEFRFAVSNRHLEDLEGFKKFLASKLEEYLNN